MLQKSTSLSDIILVVTLGQGSLFELRSYHFVHGNWSFWIDRACLTQLQMSKATITVVGMEELCDFVPDHSALWAASSAETYDNLTASLRDTYPTLDLKFSTTAAYKATLTPRQCSLEFDGW